MKGVINNDNEIAKDMKSSSCIRIIEKIQRVKNADAKRSGCYDNAGCNSSFTNECIMVVGCGGTTDVLVRLALWKPELEQS